MNRPRSARVMGLESQSATPHRTAQIASAHAVLSGPERFQAVLAMRPCARSQHFHVHHLPTPAAAEPIGSELSTAKGMEQQVIVDGQRWRLGLIVPKRHAKRAVTRSLVKRRMRRLWQARLSDMPAGDWLLRLTAPLDRKLWPSAASAPLADMVTAELSAVLDDAVRRARRGPTASRKVPPSIGPGKGAHNATDPAA